MQRETRLLLLLLPMMWALMVMSAAQPSCDPETQYENEGRCCRMCPPGRRMSSPGNCDDPRCIVCGEYEYQDTFTAADKCKRQPYCDPNKNFQEVMQSSSTKRDTCTCKLGFHCSSDVCLTCVPHRSCEPGWGVKSTGNQTQDTVCQKCPNGTFSNESSWDRVCGKWQECEDGYHVQLIGTDRRDTTCEKTQRQHGLVIGVVLLSIVVVLGLIAGIICCRSRGKKGYFQGFVESCRGEDNEPVIIILATPTADHNEEEHKWPEEQLPEETAVTRKPEENEDEPGQEMSANLLFTDNGNVLRQENGKTEILSRQESQTQPFTTAIIDM